MTAQAYLTGHPAQCEPPRCENCGSTRADILADRQLCAEHAYWLCDTTCCDVFECPECGEIGGTPVHIEASEGERDTGYREDPLDCCTLCDPRIQQGNRLPAWCCAEPGDDMGVDF